jgi:hypothetical protein
MKVREMARLAAVVAAVGTAGCYHAVVETGRTPNGTIVEDKWADSFLEGLVPPDAINTAEQCPNGVAKVETRHSFTNLLVGVLTWGVYTPMHITVHCASAGEADSAADRRVAVGAGADSRAVGTAIARAAILSDRTDAPAFVVIAE